MKRAKRTALVSLLTLALALQAAPAFAFMVGCPMGDGKAECSKWTEAKKPCCCEKVQEPRTCKMSQGCDKPSPELLKKKQEAGCKCQVIAGAVPDQSTPKHFAFHAFPIVPAEAPQAHQAHFGTRLVEPAVFGTDSSPPRRTLRTPSNPRAPPVDPA